MESERKREMHFMPVIEWQTDEHRGGTTKYMYYEIVPNPLNKVRSFDTLEECMEFAKAFGFVAITIET